MGVHFRQLYHDRILEGVAVCCRDHALVEGSTLLRILFLANFEELRYKLLPELRMEPNNNSRNQRSNKDKDIPSFGILIIRAGTDSCKTVHNDKYHHSALQQIYERYQQSIQ